MWSKNPAAVYVGLILLWAMVLTSSLCPTPQKSIYISLNSLSKRDHMELLFVNISKQTSIYNLSYHDPGSGNTYQISDLKYVLTYNSHYQREEYLDNKSIRVTLGIVNLFSQFNYLVKDPSNKTAFKGQGYARSSLDPSHIEKELVEKDGYVEWQARVIEMLQFNSLWVCEALFNLPEQQLHILEKMLNYIVDVFNFRPRIEVQINLSYKIWLKTYLNGDHLISIQTIPYTFRNISLNLTHNATNPSIDSASQGFIANIFFGVADSETKDCGSLPQRYSQNDYGGVVEYFTFQSIKSVVIQAIQRGLFNVSLDSSWQTEVFQFVMGDLSNAVPYADYYEALQSITINCNIDNVSKVFISGFDASRVYLQVPELCQLKFKGDSVIQINLQLSIMVGLKAEQEFLLTKVSSISCRKVEFKSLNPAFKVQRVDVAEMIVQSLLNRTMDSPAFGSKLPLLNRKYPSLIMNSNFLIVFDASENYKTSSPF